MLARLFIYGLVLALELVPYGTEDFSMHVLTDTVLEYKFRVRTKPDYVSFYDELTGRTLCHVERSDVYAHVFTVHFTDESKPMAVDLGAFLDQLKPLEDFPDQEYKPPADEEATGEEDAKPAGGKIVEDDSEEAEEMDPSELHGDEVAWTIHQSGDAVLLNLAILKTVYMIRWE